MLLKRCVKRACCRDLFIDPLPELDHEVFFSTANFHLILFLVTISLNRSGIRNFST